MLRLRTIGLIIALFTTPLLAELPRSSGGGGANKQRFNFPIYMGFSFPHHESDERLSYTGYTGVAFGTGFHYRLLPTILIGFDVLYLGKGFETVAYGSAQARYELNFLEFPVRLTWSPMRYLSLGFGPFLGALLIQGTRSAEGVAASTKSDFRNDYGVEGSVWIGFPAGPKTSIGVDLRYQLGLSDIDGDANPIDYIRTRTLMTLFTFTISL